MKRSTLKKLEENESFRDKAVYLIGPNYWAVWDKRALPLRAVMFGGFAQHANRNAVPVGFGDSHSQAYIDYLGKMGAV